MSDSRAALLAYLAEAPELARGALGAPPRLVLEAPSDPVYPYLMLGRFAVMAADRPELSCVTLTCVSRHGGKAEAEALVQAVRDALFGAQLELADGRRAALQVTFSDVFRAADWRLTYGVLRVRMALSAGELRIAA